MPNPLSHDYLAQLENIAPHLNHQANLADDEISEATLEDEEPDDVPLGDFTQQHNAANTNPHLVKQVIVDEDYAHWAGERIDKSVTDIFSDFSREQIKNWLASGELSVNGQPQKPKYRLKIGDILSLNAQLADQQDDLPENIPLAILYEDDAVLVINKPVNMVVHPGAGNRTGTLLNALLYHYPASRLLPRAGLVHRIDKQTTGLMVVAKNTQSQQHLINQLKNKSVYRHYQALVLANPSELRAHTRIDAPIARHSSLRTKMAVVTAGKPAVTHLDKVTPICDGLSLVNVRLETGRTHQIRVHLSHLGFALLGDPLYTNARRTAILLKTLDDEQKALVNGFQRQALHAYELGFIHPTTGENILVTAPLPEDMQALMDGLKAN